MTLLLMGIALAVLLLGLFSLSIALNEFEKTVTGLADAVAKRYASDPAPANQSTPALPGKLKA